MKEVGQANHAMKGATLAPSYTQCFTSNDLESIEDKIREITAGKRVVQLTLQYRIERYSDAQLSYRQKLPPRNRNAITDGSS